MVAPVITVPTAKFVLLNGSINFTPSTTAGAGITWTFSNLPTGGSGNSGTGAITGTLTAAGNYITKITATNVDGVDFVYMPIKVYTSITNVSQSDTFPYALNGTDKLFRLTENITVPGTAFGVTGVRPALDLATFGITFDDERDQTLVNGDFESGDTTGWDITLAPGAAVFAGSYIGRTLATGTWSLKLSVPVGQTHTISTADDYTFTEGVEYAFTMWMNKPTTTNSISIGGTSLSLSSFITNKIGTVGRWVFTPSSTVAGPVVIAITNTGASAQDVYLDRIRIDESRKHGVSIPSSAAPTISGWTVGSGLFVANGTIQQGDGANFDCAPLFWRGGSGIIAHNLTLINNADATTGDYGQPINLAFANTVHISHCTIQNLVRWIRHREQFNGSSIYAAQSSGVRVYSAIEFDQGPQSGIYTATQSGTDPVLIEKCIFKLTSKYTNGFCVNVRDLDMDIPGNIIRNNSANYRADAGLYGSRGFHINNGRNYSFSGNHMVLTEQPNNQEYSGYVLGGCYGIQFETQPSNGFLNVDGDYYEIFGTVEGGCVRLLAEPTADINTIENTTLIVDSVPGEGDACGCFRISHTDQSKFVIQNMTLKTNSALVSYDFSGNSGTLTLDDCSIEYVDDGNGHSPWMMDSSANGEVSVVNPTFVNSGSRTWFKQIGGIQSGSGQALLVTVTRDCEYTFVDGVTPQSAMQIDIEDSFFENVFSNTTNGSGVISLTLTEFTADLADLTDLSPFQITTGKPSYHTLTLTDSTAEATFDVITDDEGQFGSDAPIAFADIGTVDIGSNGAIDMPYPVPVQEGDLLVIFFENRTGVRIPNDITGFTKLVEVSGGQGSNAADSGTARSTIFTKIADGTETGDATTTVPSGSSSMGVMARFTKSPLKNWSIAGAVAEVNSASATWSAAASTNPGLTVGDLLLTCNGINTDAYTYSDHAMSANGITEWGAAQVRLNQATAVGFDSHLVVTEHAVVAGTATDVPTFTMTSSGTVASTSPAGATAFIRLRQESAVVPPTISSPADDASIFVAERTQPVVTFSVTSTPTAIPSLSGDDSDSFEMSGNLLRFIDPQHFETPTDANADNSYQVTVTYTNSGGSDSVNLTVVVQDSNEAPNDIGLSNSTIYSNVDTTGGIEVGTLSTSDPDSSDTHTYSVVGGLHQDYFSIDGNRLLIDTGGVPVESSYSVQIRTTDQGDLFFDKSLTITVQIVEIDPVPDPVVIDDGETISGRNGSRLLRTTINFSPAAGSGNIGTIPVASMVGTVFIEQAGAVCKTSLTADGVATITMGVAGDTACILGQATATDLDAGMAWAANPDEGISSAANLIVTGDIIITVAGANLTAGRIVICIYYKPLTEDGYLS